MYTLDTNTIIYYLKGESKTASVLDKIFLKNNSPIYISSITEAELFSFSGLTIKESKQINELLETLAIIPFDSRIARITGLLRRTCKINVADSAIAATAMFTGTTLITRNINDFKKIPNLSLLEI